ncbi:GNAT family N-acetyltransferase [Ginsengibacter hankyongi]|uniref:GNAT family N-acetyltransferase n=1 Tax=Ginsengibacter hankyongi TaxID=2607284 RepID=A0A5J5IKP0_9BACT|nr:GNAT family N-acetyltransferase [Ginsengibacter hankyongi]KAA9041655.1 GNAT family N-acetyltransferase [Ginsengibacter hankyongi]
MILEVNDKKTRKEFLLLPHRLYKDDRNFISPLHNDIESVFDPEKNNFHSHGICKRWILKKDQLTIGRIAAFINYEKNKNPDAIIGGIGFFECINDEAAAFELFDTAKQWLQQHNAKGMDGPVNFGENDKYWGLLIEGFMPPGVGMSYNHKYYQQFFENYGFKTLYDQYTNVIYVTKPFPDRFTKIADWIGNKPEYSFVHFEMKNFEKFAKDFMEIYNDAWSDFENFTPIKLDTIKQSFKEMRPIVDEKIIWFTYYNGEPIAFILAVPDINVILKPLKGKLNLLNKIRFLWLKKTTKIHRIRFIVMGCKKKFQNKGIESGMIRKLQLEVVPRNTITEAELAWVGDFNKKMIALHDATGAVREKVHRTYRKMF